MQSWSGDWLYILQPLHLNFQTSSANDLCIALLGRTVTKMKRSNPQPCKGILIFILLTGKPGFRDREITRSLKTKQHQSQGRAMAHPTPATG